MTKAFCEILKADDWYSGFYVNIDYLNNFYNQATNIDLPVGLLNGLQSVHILDNIVFGNTEHLLIK